jgi:hypothetical protein
LIEGASVEEVLIAEVSITEMLIKAGPADARTTLRSRTVLRTRTAGVYEGSSTLREGTRSVRIPETALPRSDER